MRFEFNCKRHGRFEVNQSIEINHEATCPTCGRPARRVYSGLEVIWGGSIYREDGSRREDEDYAPVMRNNA